MEFRRKNPSSACLRVESEPTHLKTSDLEAAKWANYKELANAAEKGKHEANCGRLSSIIQVPFDFGRQKQKKNHFLYVLLWLHSTIFELCFAAFQSVFGSEHIQNWYDSRFIVESATNNYDVRCDKMKCGCLESLSLIWLVTLSLSLSLSFFQFLLLSFESWLQINLARNPKRKGRRWHSNRSFGCIDALDSHNIRNLRPFGLPSIWMHTSFLRQWRLDIQGVDGGGPLRKQTSLFSFSFQHFVRKIGWHFWPGLFKCRTSCCAWNRGTLFFSQRL